LTHHWFLEAFAPQEADGGAGSSYGLLDSRAEQVPPGCDRLVFNPHLGGRACPTRTNYRGMWIGFTWTHRQEHFYRSVLEAIAYDQALAFQSLQRAYPEAAVEEVIVYAGGARSRLWNQIKADVMGLPYVRLDRSNLSALGAAILAGYALGIYDDMAGAAEALVARTDRFEPRPDVHAFYRAYADFYGRLLERVDPAYDELAELPEWEDG
jgi:xylulokinase